MEPQGARFQTRGGLNHVALVVKDLAAVEAKLRAAGLTPYNRGDYDPGERFYFCCPEGVEYEMVRYG